MTTNTNTEVTSSAPAETMTPFVPSKKTIEYVISGLELFDDLPEKRWARICSYKILNGLQLTPYERRSAYEYFAEDCRKIYEDQYGPFDQIEEPDDLEDILEKHIKKLHDPDIQEWIADLYVQQPDIFEDVIQKFGIDRTNLLQKFNEIVPPLDLAVLFLADKKGFRSQDAVFGSAMAEKVRAHIPMEVDEYKEIRRILSLQYYAKQLSEIQIDARHIPDTPTDGGEDEVIEEDAEPSAESAMVYLATKSGATFWMSKDEKPYVTFPNKEHFESYPISSRQARNWLGHLVYRIRKKTPRSSTIQDAITQLEGIARYDGPTHEVFIRLAKHDDKVYLDLCDGEWQVVEIGPDGWRVIPGHKASVKFRRSTGMKALPVPTRGGNFDDLRTVLNLPDDDMWLLVKGWMLMAFYPTGPYAPLVVNGESGSAKSTFCKILKEIIDPNTAPARRPPKSEQDLMIAAYNSWLLVFENLSGLSPRMADAICVLATGGGLSQRTLYTDDEETLLNVMRPVMLNGIGTITTRSDLISRSIFVNLPKIEEVDRKREADVYAKLDEIRSGVLGAILDVVAYGLKEIPNTNLDSLPRMADLAQWVTACEGALGCKPGEFMRVYDANGVEAQIDLIAGDSFLSDLVRLMEKELVYEGTVQELLAKMKLQYVNGRPPSDYPKSPKGVSSKLDRYADPLRIAGISIKRSQRSAKGRKMTIKYDRPDEKEI